MEAARKSHKPILAFKANIGRLGQKIAQSHTASLTSDDRVVDAAFLQAGILRVHDATTLGNNMKILRLPPMRGKRLAIISRSGGHAVIAADACELSGFELAHFPESFLREIEQHFRASVIKLTNPLDLGDLFDLDLYATIVEQTLRLEDVDGVIILHTALSDEENLTSRVLLERIMGLVEQYKKPVAYYLSTAAQEIDYLKQNYAFPVFTQVVETVRALEISHRYDCLAHRLEQNKEARRFSVDTQASKQLIETARTEKRDLLLSEALMLLEIYGIPTVQGRRAESAQAAQAAAEEIGYPVAIKVISEHISHKSDVGGVQLNLHNAAAVADAYAEMMQRIEQSHPQAQIDGVLVQPMAAEGRELILGGRQDPQFGPVVLVGLGGIFVEILNEVSVRVAPLARWEAREMIEELRGAQILMGARGDQASDIEAVVDSILRLAQLLQDFPEIQEVDINPLRVFYQGEGCRALDARMLLQRD
jgi:acetyltransferase